MLSTKDVASRDSIQKRKDSFTEEEIKIQATKTLKELDLGKIAIVLNPTSSAIMWKGLNSIRNNLTSISYEVVIVLPKDILLDEDYNKLANFPNVKYSEIPKSDLFVQKNIGRQLVSKGIKYILFIDTDSSIDDLDITENLVRARIAPLALEILCAVVGEIPEQSLSNTVVQEIIASLSKKIMFDMETYEEKCVTNDGRTRFAATNSMAVKTNIWDLLGGFNIDANYPGIEYCIRLQLLGYKIILQELYGR